MLDGVDLPSRRSRQSWVLMVRDDEEMLDEAIDCKTLGAIWESRGPGFWEPTYHESMIEALDAGGGTQAFLRLRRGDESVGPLFQYLSGRALRADAGQLRGGRVAYKWMPATTPADIGCAFQDLADAAMAAARSVTLPHVVTHVNKPVRGYRIGRSAEVWYLESPWPERQLCDMSTFATYRLGAEFSR
jgi:hypothetical protein